MNYQQRALSASTVIMGGINEPLTFRQMLELRPYLNNDSMFVYDGGMLIDFREWLRWQDKDGVPLDGAAVCLNTTGEALETEGDGFVPCVQYPNERPEPVWYSYMDGMV